MKSMIVLLLLTSSVIHANAIGIHARSVNVRKRTVHNLKIGAVTTTEYFLCNPAGAGVDCDDQSLPKTQVECVTLLDQRVLNKRGERYPSYSIQQEGVRFRRIPLLQGESVVLGDSFFSCEQDGLGFSLNH